MHLICFLLLALVEVTIGGESDVDVLLELKRGILSNDSRNGLASWDPKSLSPDGCPKNWLGISCANGHVTSITLNSLGLSGELNFLAISRLKMLQKFSISSNLFSGTVMKDIGLIDSLQHLDLSQNLFTGALPSQITSLKNLVLLNISSNNMEGEIPSGFGDQKHLKYLDFHSNRFVGDVMALLAQLGDLEYVDLSCNHFSGSLDLGTGNPDFVSSIRYLNISSNALTGDLFPHDGIPYFDNLQVFDASGNLFTGSVPSFSFVVSLHVIRLHNNSLSGSLPQALLRKSSMVLSELDLSNNQLEGPVHAITSVTLRSLNLSSNRLSGSLPILIGHCAIIDLSNNMLSRNVSRIQSWGNYVEVIDLSSNQLSGTLPNQTTQFLRLTSLRIFNNSVEGSLPPVLGTYPELRVIDFSLNKLSGFLLPSLFNASKLMYINLSSNNFSGVIPDPATLQNYSLLLLNLSHNALTGVMPPDISRFLRLVVLDLSGNMLEGSIPNELPSTIEVFNVSYNNLSGNVPRSFDRFPLSSFHPGNDFLVLPKAVSVSGGNGNLTINSSHKISAARTALLIGILAGASLIAMLALLIYFRVHKFTNDASLAESADVKKAVPSVGTGHENQQVDAAISTEKNRNQQGIEVKSKASMTSSPGHTSAANPSNQPGNSSSLKVCAPGELAGDLHVFDSALKLTPEELSSAPAEAIGMSCHGTLYRAVITSGTVLAVKLLKGGIAKSKKEFSREAKKLCNIRHPNLVTLQGFYWGPKEHEKLIISKYIEAPCLAFYLHGADNGKFPPLSLKDRLKVALDVACCLTYFHTESSIPHGNLKSTNILIETPNVHAFLTDYSLHRLLTPSGTAEQVLNAGALGYLPPEFTSTSKPCPSLKSDVYAFGVILLELLTGRSSGNIVSGDLQVVDLSEWVSSMAAKNRAMDCVDTQMLGGGGSAEEDMSKGVEAMLEIALKCMHSAAERPDMKMVFEELYSLV